MTGKLASKECVCGRKIAWKREEKKPMCYDCAVKIRKGKKK